MTKQPASFIDLLQHQSLSIALAKFKAFHLKHDSAFQASIETLDHSLLIGPKNSCPILTELSVEVQPEKKQGFLKSKMQQLFKKSSQDTHGEHSIDRLFNSYTQVQTLNPKALIHAKDSPLFEALLLDCIHHFDHCSHLIEVPHAELITALGPSIQRCIQSLSENRKSVSDKTLVDSFNHFNHCLHVLVKQFTEQEKSEISADQLDLFSAFLEAFFQAHEALVRLYCRTNEVTLYRLSLLQLVDPEKSKQQRVSEQISNTLLTITQVQGPLFQWFTSLKQLEQQFDDITHLINSKALQERCEQHQLNSQAHCQEELFTFLFHSFHSNETQARNVSTFIIKHYYHLLPLEQLISAIVTHTNAINDAVNTVTQQALLEGSIEQALQQPVTESDQALLTQYSDKLAELWEWLLIVSAYHIQAGKLFFLPALIAALRKQPNAEPLATLALKTMALGFSTKAWKRLSESFIEFYSEDCFSIIDTCCTAFDEQRVNQSSATSYWNSVHFLNTWQKHCRIKIADIKPQGWKQLFQHFDARFIMTSKLIEQWLLSVSKNETQCLERLAASLQKHNKALHFSLYIRAKSYDKHLQLFEQAQIQDQVQQKVISEQLDNMSKLLQHFDKQSLFAYALLNDELVQSLATIEANYNSVVSSYFVQHFLEKLSFNCALLCKINSPSGIALFQFIAAATSLNSDLKSHFIQQFFDHFSEGEKTAKTCLKQIQKNAATPARQLAYSLSNDTQSEGPHSSVTLLSDTLQLFRQKTKRFFHKNKCLFKQTTSSFDQLDSQLELIECLQEAQPALSEHLPAELLLRCDKLIQHCINEEKDGVITEQEAINQQLHTNPSTQPNQIRLAEYILFFSHILIQNQEDLPLKIALQIIVDNSTGPLIKNEAQCLSLCRDLSDALGAPNQDLDCITLQYQTLDYCLAVATKLAQKNSNFLSEFLLEFSHCLSQAFNEPRTENHLQKEKLSLISRTFDAFQLLYNEQPQSFVHSLKTLKSALYDIVYNSQFSLYHSFSKAFIRSLKELKNKSNEDHLLIERLQHIRTLETLLESPVGKAELSTLKDLSSNPSLMNCLHAQLFEKKGSVFYLVYQLLELLHSSESIDDEQCIIDYLNTIFCCAYSSIEWKNMTLFTTMLASFFDANKQSNSQAHSLSSAEQAFFIHLFQLIPAHIKELFLQSISDSTHNTYAQKQVFEQLITDSIRAVLDSPKASRKALHSHMLPELLSIYSYFEEKDEVLLIQINALLTKQKQQFFKESDCRYVIQQTLSHIKQFKTKDSLEQQHYHDSPINHCLYALLLLKQSQHLSEHLLPSKKALATIVMQILLNDHSMISIDEDLLAKNLEQQATLLFDALNNQLEKYSTISLAQLSRILVLFSSLPLKQHALMQKSITTWLESADLFQQINASQMSAATIKLLPFIPLSELATLLASQGNASQQLIQIKEQSECLFALLFKELQSVKSQKATDVLNKVTQSKQSAFIQAVLTLNSEASANSVSDFLSTLYYSPEPSLLSKQLMHIHAESIPAFKSCLELLYFKDAELFTHCLKWQHYTLGEFLCDTLILNNNSLESLHPALLDASLRLSPLHTQFHDMINTEEYAGFLKQSRNPSLIQELINNNQELTTEQLISYINIQYHNNRSDLCLIAIEKNHNAWSNLLAQHYFNKSSIRPFENDCILFLLQEHPHFESCLQELSLNYGLSLNKIMQTLLPIINSAADNLRFHPLLQQLINHLSEYDESSPDNNPISKQLRALFSLSYNRQLQLRDILTHIQSLGFLPPSILAIHMKRICEAFLIEDQHEQLLQLSIDSPALFKSILLSPDCASKLQHLIFYNQINPNSLLYRHIDTHIQQFSSTQSLFFLSHYASAILDSKKNDELNHLIQHYFPKGFIHRVNKSILIEQLPLFKENYFDIVNHSIVRIPINDPLVTLVFERIQKAPVHQESVDSIMAFLLSDSSPSSSSNELDSIKEQFSTLCQDKNNRQLFLYCLRHSIENWKLPLFSKFIHGWEQDNSLYSILNSYIIDHLEKHMLHQYFEHIAQQLCALTAPSAEERQRYYPILLCLLSHSVQSKQLLNWHRNSLCPHAEITHCPALIQSIAIIPLSDSSLIDLLTAYMQANKQDILLACFETLIDKPVFFSLLAKLFSESPEHSLVAQIGLNGSNLQAFFVRCCEHFMKDKHSQLFRLAALFDTHALPFEPILIALYQKESDTKAIVESTRYEAFIRLCKEAIYQEQEPFLCALAHFVKSSLDTEQRNLAWLTQSLLDFYRIPIRTSAQANDNSVQNTMIKRCVASGLLSDKGECLIPLDELTHQQIKQFINLEQSSPEQDQFLLDLKELYSKQSKQLHTVLSVFLKHCSELFLLSSPTLDKGKNEESSSHFISRQQPLLDSLFSLAFQSNSVSATLNNMLLTLYQNDDCQSKLLSYMKQLNSEKIFFLLFHNDLNAANREVILHMILDNNNAINDDKQQQWKDIIINELITQSIQKIDAAISFKDKRSLIEILLYFFCYYPSHLWQFKEESFPSIYRKLDLALMQLYHCKVSLESMLHHDDSFKGKSLQHVVTHLYDHHFNYFDFFYAYQSAACFNKEALLDWVNAQKSMFDLHFLSQNTQKALKIYEQMHQDLPVIAIDETLFKESPLHMAWKNWLFKEGLLDENYHLSLLNYEQFTAHTNPEKCLEGLMQDCNSQANEEKEVHAKHFFETFFERCQAYKKKTRLKAMEMSLLLRKLFVNNAETTHFVKSIRRLEEHIASQDILKLLNMNYSHLLLCACYQQKEKAFQLKRISDIVHSIEPTIQFQHPLFANIDKPQLSAFKDNLKKHAVIDKQNKLNRKALLQYQPTQSTMQHCLDKLNLYNTSQDELSIEALLLVCKLGIILFGPRDEAKKQCIALCKKLSDDHWLFLKQLLKQQYEGQHIQALFERKLASFNAQEKSIALSKDYLQHLAISLSDSSDNEQESLLKSLLKNT